VIALEEPDAGTFKSVLRREAILIGWKTDLVSHPASATA
jgi:hypothetical protein